MLKSEQIPVAVAYEVFKRFEMDTEREAAEAIAAALNAWPGSYSLAENDSAVIRDGSFAVVILPLPQEPEHD